MEWTKEDVKNFIKNAPVFECPIDMIRITYDVKSQSGTTDEEKIRDFAATYLANPLDMPPIAVHGLEASWWDIDDGRTRFFSALRAGLRFIRAVDVSCIPEKARVLYVAWAMNEQRQAAPMTNQSRIAAAIVAFDAGCTNEEIRIHLLQCGVAPLRARDILSYAESRILERKKSQMRDALRKHGDVAVAAQALGFSLQEGDRIIGCAKGA